MKEETGIQVLDTLLEGGLGKSKVYLIAGESGTGKTIFGMEFIYTGLQKGERAVYLTGDLSEDLLDEARGMGWDLGKYLRTRQLTIMTVGPYLSRAGGGLAQNMARLLSDLVQRVTDTRAERLVIDSIAFISEVLKSDDAAITYLSDLVNSLTGSVSCTTIIADPVPSESRAPGDLGVLEHLSNGIITLHAEKGRGKELYVRKMRQSGVSLMRYAFRIEPERGIVISPLPMDRDARPLALTGRIPEFSLQALQQGSVVKVSGSDFAGKWLVVVFYPGDFTFVCPTELEELADRYNDFRALGAEIVSISMDNIATHRAWREASPAIAKIRYPMGSDPDGTVSSRFGAYLENGGTLARATFIFDPEGTLQVMDLQQERIGRNTDETLRQLEALKYTFEHPDELCPASWKPGGRTLKRPEAASQ